MRIAYALMEFPALTETFVTTECDLLEAHGAAILPFSLRSPRDAASLPQTWLSRTHCLGRATGAGLRSIPAARRRQALAFIRDQFMASPAEGAFAARALPVAAAIAARRSDFDAVHTHFERGAAILAALAGILADRPWSFTAHAFGAYLSNPVALAQRLREAAFVRASHAALAIHLRALAPTARLVTIPTPIDISRLPARSEGLRPRSLLQAVVVARDVPKKGLDLLGELRRQLGRRGLAVDFRVIGPFGPRPTWAAPGVVPLGRMSHTETLQQIASADLIVAPCRIAPNGDRDGVPLALIEAPAIRVPAFSTRVGGIPELFGRELAEHLAAPEDTAGLADAIVRGVLAPPAPASEAAARVRLTFGAAAARERLSCYSTT